MTTQDKIEAQKRYCSKNNCPHCNKDTDLIYPEGMQPMTRTEAEEHLSFLISQIDNVGASVDFSHPLSKHTEKRRQWDRLMDQAGKIEVALGL